MGTLPHAMAAKYQVKLPQIVEKLEAEAFLKSGDMVRARAGDRRTATSQTQSPRDGLLHTFICSLLLAGRPRQ